MKTRNIIWAGDERFIPDVGLATKDCLIKDVPEHVATSFVYQGLANYEKKDIKASTTKSDSED